MAKKEEFDVLTFFIYVMVLLTAIVAGMALWNQSLLNARSREIRSEVSRLHQMQALAANDDLRDWIARAREGAGRGAGPGRVSDFQQLYTNTANRLGLRIENHTPEGMINHRGVIEMPFRLVIKNCRVEELVTFLAQIEEAWPGAQVKQIVKLDFSDRDDSWEAVVVLSIFQAG